VTITNGATLTVGSATTNGIFKQNSLTVQGTGSKFALLQGSLMVADIRAWDIPTAQGGKLDLTDNDLIIRADTPAAGRANLDGANGVEGKILAAQNGLDASFITKWDGPGLTSSAARTRNVTAGFDLVGLGAILNGDLDTVGLDAFTTFGTAGGGAISVGPNDVLVKYTYLGDLNFDGTVTFDDYALWEAGYFENIPNLGWISGDINYDGLINFDDAAVMDQAFFNQGDPLSGTGIIPVPEPGAWLSAGLGLVGLLLARRRTGTGRRL
jgi:hypothetical protein